VGTEVYAVQYGTVTAIGWSPTWGNYLRLYFNEGYTAFYAHLERVAVSVYDEVARGQVVAYSGNTGRSTGPHLHFGLFKDGQYVNPVSYVYNEIK
jgi:murein DD-endopeptidase MepM/ murein hydrolase activator NlpD